MMSAATNFFELYLKFGDVVMATTNYNIYSEMPFSLTDYNQYLIAVVNGLKLTNYYDYSTDCQKYTVLFLDDLFYYHNNRSVVNADWNHQMYNISGIIGGNFNNMLYKCYLFKTSVDQVTTQRMNAFVDTEDIYTSFLFKLLSNSL